MTHTYRTLVVGAVLLLVLSGCRQGILSGRGWTDHGPVVVCTSHLPFVMEDPHDWTRAVYLEMEGRPKPLVSIDTTDTDSDFIAPPDTLGTDSNDERDFFADSLIQTPPPILLDVKSGYNLYSRPKGRMYQYALYHRSGNHPLVPLKKIVSAGTDPKYKYFGYNYTGFAKDGSELYVHIDLVL